MNPPLTTADQGSPNRLAGSVGPNLKNIIGHPRLGFQAAKLTGDSRSRECPNLPRYASAKLASTNESRTQSNSSELRLEGVNLDVIQEYLQRSLLLIISATTNEADREAGSEASSCLAPLLVPFLIPFLVPCQN